MYAEGVMHHSPGLADPVGLPWDTPTSRFRTLKGFRNVTRTFRNPFRVDKTGLVRSLSRYLQGRSGTMRGWVPFLNS
jgi:hypothetical protein